MGATRNVVRIDEDKCDGCGECVLACAEGAIQVIDGKAKLVGDNYCDGLGACLGDCPQGAITIERREADAFDPDAVREHLLRLGQPHHPAPAHPAHPHRTQAPDLPCGCPGSAARDLRRPADDVACDDDDDATPVSRLGNWPVQLHLVPPRAPYLDGADLLLAADCVPFAHADFHRRFLRGRTLLIGCPKLDDGDFYRRKLAQILMQNDVRSLHVAHMEVPCCFGIVEIARRAIEESGKAVPLRVTNVGVRGGILEERTEPGARPAEARP